MTVPWSGASTYRGAVTASAGVALFMWAAPVLGGIGAAGAPAARVAVIAALEGMLLAVAWRFGVHPYRSPMAALGFRRTGLVAQTALPVLAVTAIVAFTAGYVQVVDLLRLSSLKPPAPPEVLLGLHGLLGAAVVAVVVLWGPLAEETFFRGFLFQGLEPALGFLGAAAASALLFALSHGSIALVLPTFVAGMLLAWVFRRTRSLGPCFAVHALQNGLALSVAR